jgi:cupin fold WbuC family metalloprotein
MMRETLDRLTEDAKNSPRLRMSLDLRTNPQDQSQRILNALEPGTVLPVHRHRTTAETVIIIRGSLREDFYNDRGEIVESYVLEVGGDTPVLQIPAGQWHSVECLESGTIIFEAKDGSYAPLTEEDVLRC